MKFKNDWTLNSELPVLTPWKTTQPINTSTWTLERNPYSIWVDTEGNQLPYIDTIQFGLAENLEGICSIRQGRTFRCGSGWPALTTVQTLWTSHFVRFAQSSLA